MIVVVIGVTLVLVSVLLVCSLPGCGGTMLINETKTVNPANSGCGTADFANEAKRQAQEQGTDSKDSKSSLDEGTSDISKDSEAEDYVKSSDVDSTGVTIQSQSADSSDQISTLPLEDGQKPVVD